MPDHVHGIVRVLQKYGRPAGRPYRGDGPARLVSQSLGAFIAGYKGAAGKRINALRGTPGAVVWHRNYWDVIVRNETALERIRQYIRMNPQNHHAVMNAPAPRFLGNRSLMDLPKLGFLASRGAANLHGRLPLRSGEAVLSGFLSPMERAVFRAGLAGNRPMIWVKPWGLRKDTDRPAVRRALDEGRLLVVSPFDDETDVPSLRRAAWCNHYVLEHSDRVEVGYLNPDGMLACVLSEADPEMAIAFPAPPS
jgi:hypothetical protein